MEEENKKKGREILDKMLKHFKEEDNITDSEEYYEYLDDVIEIDSKGEEWIDNTTGLFLRDAHQMAKKIVSTPASLNNVERKELFDCLLHDNPEIFNNKLNTLSLKLFNLFFHASTSKISEKEEMNFYYAMFKYLASEDKMKPAITEVDNYWTHKLSGANKEKEEMFRKNVADLLAPYECATSEAYDRLHNATNDDDKNLLKWIIDLLKTITYNCKKDVEVLWENEKNTYAVKDTKPNSLFAYLCQIYCEFAGKELTEEEKKILSDKISLLSTNEKETLSTLLKSKTKRRRK